jgi:hypothetical protein
MKLIDLKTKEVFALYHFLQVYPELYSVQLTSEFLKDKGFAILEYADKPKIEPYQQIIEGSIVGNIQQWAIEDLPLESLKQQKTEEVNAWRDNELLSPVSYSGFYFDADQQSQFRVLAVVMLGGGSPTGYWTSADNQDVFANADFMKGLYSAMLTKVATVHHLQRQMKNAIQQLNTSSEVYNYKVGS